MSMLRLDPEFEPRVAPPKVTKVVLNVVMGRVVALSADLAHVTSVALVSFQTPNGAKFARVDIDKGLLLDVFGFDLQPAAVSDLCESLNRARTRLLLNALHEGGA